MSISPPSAKAMHVDHLARLMEQEGISRYLVSVGGALNSRGMNGEGLPWRVAIQKPTDKEKRGSGCGGYQRSWD
ncbi:FAD:protein FMN transferase [Escherichia coli]|nr:FAD:protein FMN transferase [Escherichia coli]